MLGNSLSYKNGTLGSSAGARASPATQFTYCLEPVSRPCSNDSMALQAFVLFRRILYFGLLAFMLWTLGRQVQNNLQFSNPDFSPLHLLTGFVFSIPCLFLLEALYLWVSGRGLRSSSIYQLFRPSSSRETDLLFFWIFYGAFIPTALLSFPNDFVRDWLGSLALPVWTSSLPLLNFCFTFLVYSFLEFILHYACHRVPALWELHKIHHSAEEMTILTAQREHLFVNVLKNLLVPLTLGLLGLNRGSIAVIFIFRQFLIHMQHSKIDARWGQLGQLLITPHAHRIHHLNDVRYFNRNFGFDITLWDRIFRTHLRTVELSAEEMDARLGLGPQDFRDPRTHLTWQLGARAWEGLRCLVGSLTSWRR